MNGNPELKIAGGRVDTGRKYVDASGNKYVIYRKTLALDGTTGALPNNTTKNVAHGEANIALTKYAKVVSIFANNGTAIKTEASVGVTADINATNIVVATTTDLTLYVGGVVTIEFCVTA